MVNLRRQSLQHLTETMDVLARAATDLHLDARERDIASQAWQRAFAIYQLLAVEWMMEVE